MVSFIHWINLLYIIFVGLFWFAYGFVYICVYSFTLFLVLINLCIFCSFGLLQEYLRRNCVAMIVNKRIQNAVLGCNLINDRMISVHFQGKPFNIMVIQVYAPTSNAEEAKVEWFFEDLQNLLKLTPKKDVLFIIGA